MLYLVETVVGKGTRCRKWELFKEKQKHSSGRKRGYQKEPHEFGLELQITCYLLHGSCERKELLAKIGGPREDLCDVFIVKTPQ